MKKIIKLCSLLIFIIVCFIIYLLVNVPKNKEILETTNLTIPLGEVKKIIINNKAEYEVLDDSIASVDNYGNVTGLKKGKTDILITTENNEYKCMIEVIDPILDINTFYNQIELTIGLDKELSFILKENVKIDRYEYDNSIIEVNDGIIKGLKIGNTKLRVYTDKGTYKDIEVIVNDYVLNLDRLKLEIFVGSEEKISLYSNTIIDNVIWISDDSNIATVNDGYIKGINVGETLIKAIVNNKEVSCFVKVIDKISNIDVFKLNDSFVHLKINDVYEIKPIIVPNNIPNNLIKYEILDSNIAVLDDNKIIGKSRGKTLLKASLYDKEYTITIYVDDNYSSDYIKNMFLDNNYNVNDIVSFFDDVALNNEYIVDENSKKIQKWNGPIYYYYNENADNDDIKQIEKIASLLNEIPGFPGMFHSSLENSNLIINFTSYDVLYNLVKVKGVEGYSTIYFDNNIINRSDITINYNLKRNIKNSVIAEEIFHSIGLKNDSKMYSDSIFYEYGSLVEIPSNRDLLLAHLLYSEYINYGMNNVMVREKIKSIIK